MRSISHNEYNMKQWSDKGAKRGRLYSAILCVTGNISTKYWNDCNGRDAKKRPHNNHAGVRLYADVRNLHILEVRRRYTILLLLFYYTIPWYRKLDCFIWKSSDFIVCPSVRRRALPTYSIIFYRYCRFMSFIPLHIIIVMIFDIRRSALKNGNRTYPCTLKKINKYPAVSVCCRFPRSQRTHISLKIDVTGQIEFQPYTYDRRTTRLSRFPPICMCAHR